MSTPRDSQTPINSQTPRASQSESAPASEIQPLGSQLSAEQPCAASFIRACASDASSPQREFFERVVNVGVNNGSRKAVSVSRAPSRTPSPPLLSSPAGRLSGPAPSRGGSPLSGAQQGFSAGSSSGAAGRSVHTGSSSAVAYRSPVLGCSSAIAYRPPAGGYSTAISYPSPVGGSSSAFAYRSSGPAVRRPVDGSSSAAVVVCPIAGSSSAAAVGCSVAGPSSAGGKQTVEGSTTGASAKDVEFGSSPKCSSIPAAAILAQACFEAAESASAGKDRGLSATAPPLINPESALRYSDEDLRGPLPYRGTPYVLNSEGKREIAPRGDLDEDDVESIMKEGILSPKEVRRLTIKAIEAKEKAEKAEKEVKDKKGRVRKRVGKSVKARTQVRLSHKAARMSAPIPEHLRYNARRSKYRERRLETLPAVPERELADDYIFSDDETDMDEPYCARASALRFRRHRRVSVYNERVRVRATLRRVKRKERLENLKLHIDGRRVKFDVTHGSTFGKPRDELDEDEIVVDSIRRSAGC